MGDSTGVNAAVSPPAQQESMVPVSEGTGSSTHCKGHINNAAMADKQPVCAGGSGSGAINWERVKSAKTKLEDAKLLLKATPIDYPTAIDLLDDVCSILKTELGDLSIETTEALFYYGTALLEQYQTGENLVGSTAKKVIDQYATELVVEAATDLVTTETDKATENEDKLADPESMDADSVELADAEESGEDQEEDDDDAAGEINEVDPDGEFSNQSDLQSLPGGGALEEEAPSGSSVSQVTSKAGDQSNEVSEVVGSSTTGDPDTNAVSCNAEGDFIPELRYAWEILETARVGYEKRLQEGATLDEKLRLSEIHYKLSLCAAENGQQNLALVEAERSLKVCKDACGPTDRELAEAYFNMGSVMSVYGMLSEAAENMKFAVSILENRKAQITNQVQTLQVQADVNKHQVERLQQDIKDIEDLIPDLMVRIQDTYEDMRLGSEEAKQMLTDWLKGVSEKSNADAGISPDPAKPITDISHLVRRVKRTTGEEDEASKKLKGADGSAVPAAANGNGHVSKEDTEPESPVV